jgi:hypothetical protein
LAKLLSTLAEALYPEFYREDVKIEETKLVVA